ncbi:MAG: cytochrome b [Alphaproteobacteria bacterium MarineAlpha5_Bin8]|nr:MAG: cytochrome b [Alphaproteobacteria bacterium MarineAlpha5_Bin7]PPR47607.1 MAG: cytochrome b [Alphaproteobacteria bacterium MarineAlpha5_Bin8]PPR53379.1 MAG: cytochrome b [Alphaproteobacteria bacterium MarineAlpha5_Bin6]|tara:strand:- start:1471 stop:2703 length:1233 start_codon:yes stop_codon:yes gene_type:complete
MQNSSEPKKYKNSFLNWIEYRLPIVSYIEKEYGDYPMPKNCNYFWSFGALASIILVILIVSGIFLAMNYTPHTDMAFNSVERIMRDVSYGWLLRYLHSNGAAFFFIVVYIHMLRSMYYGSYKYPRELNWILGVFIFLLMMATSFLGYVLPWGQMSYWGATVITNLFSAIPLIGEGLKTWILGDYTVGNATLNRFFALHYVLPFVILGVVGLHVAAVHVHGSNNPAGIDIKSKDDTVKFFPYMLVKDTFMVCVFGVVISAIIFFGPNLMAEVDNYIPADPLVTPSHIVANWYLAPFYAILRAIPDKLGGVILMFGAIAILFILPWLDSSKTRSCNYRPIYKWFMMLFFVNFFVLGYVGMMPAEGIYLLIARIGLVYYFAFFLIITPLIGKYEKPGHLPASIRDVYIDGKNY